MKKEKFNIICFKLRTLETGFASAISHINICLSSHLETNWFSHHKRKMNQIIHDLHFLHVSNIAVYTLNGSCLHFNFCTVYYCAESTYNCTYTGK